MLHTCLLLCLPLCLCVRSSVSVRVLVCVCVWERVKVARVSTVCWHANLNFRKLCEFLLTIGILLQLFCFCSPATAAGRAVRKVGGDSDSSCLVPHRCRAWTAVANDWGLILWCFCAYPRLWLRLRLWPVWRSLLKRWHCSRPRRERQGRGGQCGSTFCQSFVRQTCACLLRFFPFSVCASILSTWNICEHVVWHICQLALS